jgi:hypothetical protein
LRERGTGGVGKDLAAGSVHADGWGPRRW